MFTFKFNECIIASLNKNEIFKGIKMENQNYTTTYMMQAQQPSQSYAYNSANAETYSAEWTNDSEDTKI